MSSCEARPLSRRKIRNMAKWIRDVARISDLYFPIADFLERVLPQIDENFDLIITDEIPDDCEAITFPDLSVIKVRPSVYDEAVQGDGRARFTLCHELFHYLFHGKENISFPSSDKEVPAFSDPEWQANTFAAELLIPKDLVKGMDIYEIHDKCGVSMQCAHIQIEKYARN